MSHDSLDLLHTDSSLGIDHHEDHDGNHHGDHHHDDDHACRSNGGTRPCCGRCKQARSHEHSEAPLIRDGRLVLSSAG